MAKKKEKLFKDLANTWCRLAPSGIQGVGVFAIRDIPKGIHPFLWGTEDWICVNKEELADIPPEVFGLIKTYCIFKEGKYWLPKYGFKMWDMVTFLNHSKKSNVVSIRDGEDFVTIKPIRKGEELFVNYNDIDDDHQTYYDRPHGSKRR